MIRRRLWMLASLVLCLASVTFAGDEDEGATYTLGAPLQPGFVTFCKTPPVSDTGNRWMNGAFAASGGVATNVAVSAKNPDNASQKRYSLVSSELGFGWQRNQPDYYLSDVVAAPDNVDWNATKALYDETYAAYEAEGRTPAFLYNPDPKNHCIYAAVGGTQKFSWVLQNGTTNTITYTIAQTCSGRPRRIYWTDSPYNAPAVSLEGRYVRIFDNNGVTTVVRGTVTNDVGGVQTISDDTIVRGVYIDASSQIMYAVGQPEGQFVIAYYDTGDYNNILCVEVIEACRPEAVAATGWIGTALEPTGLGYDIEGLEALVTAGIGDADDDRGDYLYQHAGNESYSPKNKSVFPLRPSVGTRWKAEIYWMETDPMGVQWPFELDQYENDWPESGSLYVRGDLDGDPGAKIYIPSDYTAELQSYQEPDGHAVAVDGNNVFYTTGAGWSLLKLTANDNVWWVPIHSVLRSDTGYFTLESHDVTVGQEFRLQGGTKSGIAFGAKELVTATDDAPGYIYRGASSGAYNVDLYHDTTSATDPSATQTTTDDSLPSVVYAVNESDATIEVWWSRRVKRVSTDDALPYWIDIPCLPQVYHPVWPDTTEAPTLVIASQKGGAGESLFQQYGAATFEKSNGRLHLASHEYFPNGEGMLTFWTRPSKDSDPIEGVTNAPTALIQLGVTNGVALVMRIGHGEKLEMLVGTNLVTAVALPKLARPNVWTHIALAISDNASKYKLYVNAEEKASGALENADFLCGTLTRCVAGRALEMPEGLVLGDPEEKIVDPPEFDPDDVTWVECTTWEQVRDNLLAGRNVRLKAPITQGGEAISLKDGQNVVLDLYGYTLTRHDSCRLFDLDSDGCELSIIDSSAAQSGKITCNAALNVQGGCAYVVKGHLVLYGGAFTGKTSSSCNGGFAYVEKTGRMTMNGGTLAGCEARYGGAIFIGEGASATINGGTISSCSSAVNGGAILNAGTLTVNGGTITGCRAPSGFGGAIQTEKGSKLTMNYGVIANCTAADSGGAVYCKGGSNFTMNGGIIRANEATEKGGAVMVEDAVFTMNAGLIGTNTAAKAWGGVCATGDATFTLNGGAIVGNKVGENRSCVGCENAGEVVLNGGGVDVEPIAANVNPSGSGSFIEPIYFGNPNVGLYRIALGVQTGRQLAEITMRSKVLAATDVKDARYKILTGSEEGLTGYYSFRPGEDLASIYQTAIGADFRRFNERVSGCELCRACNTALETPGAPGYHSRVISADATPSVYWQNDETLDGYNPNEEHAIVTSGAGGYIAWALRCDLNTATSSKPGVLVQYEKDGEAKMQFFHVVVTNATWPALAATCTAARQLPGPQPITLMEDPWLAEDHWDADPANPGKPGIAYRDRKGQLWARCAGTLPIYMYYRSQEGFWFPQYDAANQPAVGTAVPWLALLKNAEADPMRSEPAVWTWTVSWPDAYNEMKIGQTLYTATDGLPGVYNMASASVVYPTDLEETSNTRTVVLIDPTVEQSVAFDYDLLKELGLSTDPNGGLNLRKGKYYFNDLPPNLSTRIWVDSSNNKLCLQGKWDEKNAGTSILYLNVLTAHEHEQLRNVVPADMRKDTDAYNTWCAAVAELGKERVEPNRMTASAHEVKTTYTPRDSYALAAIGNTNWVVLIENDAPTTNYTVVADGVCETNRMGVTDGDAISMHVFRVVPEYYVPKSYNGIVTREDEQNLLSQRLSILYVEGFGGESDKYEFQWKSKSPNADGTIPEDYDTGYELRATNAWADASTPHITVGEQGDTLANMVNKYWICRYRAKDSSCPAWGVMGNAWSDWCTPPALAEGWVQRVLNNVTPFNQLMTDLYENEAETAITMIQKAGKPYTGDVALNQDALTECGLIELYETMFNKAESMSLLLNVRDTDANKQLLLCAERLGDMYTVLGDEAYSDAKNPTIGFGMNIASVENQPSVDFGSASSALFCFDNQVSTLLDEELALLRGRTGESAPIMTTAPYYNRLLWNFTKGITAGEVAYAVNYNISGTETTALSEEQAARLYPQGHGDAYGHYLSALKGWYRLMRNPNFNWSRAQGEMNIADASVNVDYYEEAKFSEAALKVARTAADVVDLTARKAYGEDGEEMAGYKDETDDRAFGYGEWANRGAYGALVNWAVANSLLPEDSSIATTGLVNGVETLFHDTALMRIDRGTVDELAEICTQAAAIQSAEDRIDAGLNPLGLDANAIPFDITPIGANDGTMTHYEQIRERAGTAMANARAILDRAQDYSSRLAMIQEGAEDYADQIEEAELDYNQELIGYYGTPYSDDIGPGKTYEQDYDGPDTVHYMWMDLSKFNLDALDKNTMTVCEWAEMNDITSFASMLSYWNGTYEGRVPCSHSISLELSAYGVVAKPANITGTRTTQGTIQEKYADFLLKYKAYSTAIWTYDDAIDKLNNKIAPLTTLLSLQEVKSGLDQINAIWLGVRSVMSYSSDSLIETYKYSMTVSEDATAVDANAADQVVVVGLSNGTNPKAVANEVTGAVKKTSDSLLASLEYSATMSSLKNTLISDMIDDALKIYSAAISEYETDLDYADKVRSLIDAVNTACRDTLAKARELNVAIEAYKSEIAKAEQVLEKREANRKKYVNKLSQWRYNDMFFRLLRNQALSRYTAAFDLAQKYVWQAAKVYGYETGLVDDDGSAANFMREIVASRSLGSFDSDDNPIVGDVGDTGLAGLLAQMDANWLVLKPRLGINNPQEYATWFSLRGECFRILSGEEGDAAWAKELTKYWTDDITSNADFIRYCQPFQSQFGLKDQEPGLIIPFETTIDFAKNFFGQDLAGEDNAYDSTWYATRIAAAGLWFDGYNSKAEGYKGKALLANTPVAYLVPMGYDCMRVPGLEDGDVLAYNVVDQVIAAPYAIGSQYLNDLSWFPSASDGDLGGADETTKIRKHPSFRAYFDTTGGEPTDGALDCTRLVGRSVWNTRWMLVIPAGGMNADRDKALSVFINGSDVNRDGKLDLLPVSDIRIGFKTYSNSGN